MNNAQPINPHDVKRLAASWSDEKDRMLALFFAIQEQLEKHTPAWHLADIGYELSSDTKELNALVRSMGIDPIELLDEVDA